MQLSIIIVNYNTTAFLKKCLNSIISFTKEITYEIIVVDNNSSDREIEKFPELFPNVNFLLLKSNRGFGDGCNKGSNISIGKYLAFVNPDITIENNAFFEFVKFLERNKNVGLCAGLLIGEDRNPQYCFNYFPGIKWEFHEAFGLLQSRTINKLLSHPYILKNEKMEFEVDWFHGACIVLEKKVFEKVKGFDDNIFLYYEDVDICQKVKKEGLSIMCLPYLRLIHYTRSSVRSVEGMKAYYYYMHKSKIYYMKLYFNIFKRSFVRLMYITGSFLKIAALPLRAKYKNEFRSKLEHYLIIIKVHLNIPVKINI